MRIHSFLLLLAFPLLAAAGWFGWHWYTTPVPPELPLEHMDRAVAEVMQTALDGVHHNPRDGTAWGKLALATAANGYERESIACLVQAERFDPQDPRWPYLRGLTLLAGHPHEALPLLERALERAGSREQQAAIRFRLALALIEDSKLDAADEHLQALRAIEPSSARVNFALGLLAAERDQRPVAREYLQAAVNSPFASQQAHARLAALVLADGDTALARHYQQRAAEAPADMPWPDPFVDEQNAYAVGRQSRFLEAASLEARGKGNEAVALLRRIAQESPDARSYLELGRLLGNLGAHQEAESMLRAVVAMEPDNLQAHHFLGAVLFLEGEQQAATGGKERAQVLFRAAIAEQDRVLAIQPDHAMAHLMRGRALVPLGRTDEALKALRQAVHGRPEFSDMHLYLGEALAQAGHVREALLHLEDAARLARPGDARARQALEKWRKVSAPPA
jgi:tetratricopeptide (TPR) repeat protein